MRTKFNFAKLYVVILYLVAYFVAARILGEFAKSQSPENVNSAIGASFIWLPIGFVWFFHRADAWYVLLGYFLVIFLTAWGIKTKNILVFCLFCIVLAMSVRGCVKGGIFDDPVSESLGAPTAGLRETMIMETAGFIVTSWGERRFSP